MDQAPQALRVERWFDAINIGAPYAEPLRPRLSLARQELGDAGPVVGEGVDAGEALGDELVLEPEPVLALHHEDLSEKVTVPVLAPSAKSELDGFAGGKNRQCLLGLIDQGPRIVAPASSGAASEPWRRSA